MDYIDLINQTGLDLAVILQFTNEEIMLYTKGRGALTPEEQQVPDFLKNHIIVLIDEEGNTLKIGLFQLGKFIKWISEDYMKMLAHGWPVSYLQNIPISEGYYGKQKN